MSRQPDPAPDDADNGTMASAIALVRLLGEKGGSRFWTALLLLVLGGLTEGLSILLIIPLLALAGGDGTLSLDLPTNALGPVSIGLPEVLVMLVVLIGLHGVFTRYKNIYLADLLFSILNRVRIDLFSAIAGLRWDFLVRQRPSDLHHLLTNDVERVYSAAMAVVVLLQTTILLLIYLGVSWIISPWMTLIAAGLGLLILTILTPLRRRATRFGIERTGNKREQYRTVSEFLGGIKTAKIHSAERLYCDRLERNLERVHGEAVGYMRLVSLGTIVAQLISALAIATLVYAGIAVWQLPLPQLVAFLLILARISPRFMSLQSSAQDLFANLTVFQTVTDFQATCRENRERDADEGSTVPPLMLTREIGIANVRYTYPGERAQPVLNGVSFTIPAGQITALIGASGSGKSTLADIIGGLLQPQDGGITIDGIALDHSTARNWRRQVAYVPQDPFLLHDGIAANLRLACPDATDDQIWQALEQANAAQFVRQFPAGLHTVLGENGATLSGGQRQRLALARALVMRPQLLILDEATSALDWESQDLIARSLEALRGTVTILTIAHRPSLVACADKVIALEDGRVAEAGSFDALALSKGPLARMVEAEGPARARVRTG